ncbi:MAG: DUF2019 domain-containing protein [Thermoanaerobaculia bacterium]
MAAFAEAAALNGAAGDAGDYRTGNRQYDRAIAIYRELRHRGSSAQKELLSLLPHNNAWVRYWAAVVTLEFAPDQAAPVLEALIDAQGSAPLRLNVSVVLSEWRKGTSICNEGCR